MAYLHCHNCDWSQDDFYHFYFRWKDIKNFILLRWQNRPFGYNPFSKIIEDIGLYIKPRMIEWDCGFVKYEAQDLIRYTGINVKFRTKQVKASSLSRLKHLDNQDQMVDLYYCFSWSWLLLELVKDIKNTRNTKWRSYKSFEKDRSKGIAKCPKCGSSKHFDID